MTASPLICPTAHALRLHADRAVGDHFAEAAGGQVGPAFRAAHGFAHVRALDELLVLFSRDEGRLAGDVGEPAEAGGQLAVPGGDPRAVLDQRHHAGTVDRQQLFVAHDSRQHAGVLLDALRVASDSGVEIRQDLEQLREIVVVGVEQVVQVRVAEQDHLKVYVDRLGSQRRPGPRKDHLRRDDLERARSQRPHEDLPRVGLAEHVARFEHEIAAVGAQQRTGGDAHVGRAGLAVA